MQNEVAVYEEQPLTAVQIRSQVDLIQSVMKEVMQDGQHYGLIPGCGDKPSLLKPGAEKIMFTFRLVPDPEVEVIDLYHPTVPGHREYRVKVKVHSRGGVYLGAGVGSCSTMEGKYRFRGGEKVGTGQLVPKEYWNLKNIGKLDEAKKLIGGDGFGVGKINGQWEICEIGEKQEHDNPADFYNTCEKMAKKRALVDATLTVTAASDIFTQDIEDMAENGVAPKKTGAGNGEAKQDAKESIRQPQKKAEGDKPAIKDPEAPCSEAQTKAIFAMCGKLGIKDDFEVHKKASRLAGIPGDEVVTSLKDFTKGQASNVIDALNKELDK